MPGEPASALSEEAQSWFFGCSACGKCCNSPPRLLLPELFRLERSFIGCLGVGRGGAGLELFVHAFGSMARSCPALEVDGRCRLHATGKPTICSIVPLDPAATDAEQGAVLRERRLEARYLGADCIRDRPGPGFRVVVRRLRVVDPELEAQLADYRQAQQNEDRFWRRALHDWLAPELMRSASLPAAGVALSLSLSPVLLHVARASEACRARVQRFLFAQAELTGAEIAVLLQRKDPNERREIAVLRGFQQQIDALAQRLHAPRSIAPPWPVAAARELELWLGVNATA